ncbi:hypothetical protein [Cellulomonas sp. PhB143]|uniref:hypothetical protein n=1 Tax=Cellulomonas sp. PhB143 TaxID=2485186 RepID=UPI000F495161|nr:hypothetical protein [Cellulomonas sp. PhB143]ROS76987.1 hypothetical protein EDF32_0974 [Cellulomonas sp. PhB143]
MTDANPVQTERHETTTAPPARPGRASRLVGRLHSRLLTGGAERGDVPGWVLVTLMTAGLVIALWAVAGPLLTSAFQDAIEGVNGP